MKERPILFSAPMVRAILNGRKTQTRRIAKLPRGFTWINENKGIIAPKAEEWPHYDLEESTSPYGRPGDRLWVRESWHIEARRQSESQLNMTVAYKPCSPQAVENGWPQDSKDFDLPPDTPIPSPNVPTYGKNGIRWRPSIHMPRWASRITLEITDVRVERPNKISEADALAEGIEPLPTNQYKDYGCKFKGVGFSDPRLSFRSLWISIHGYDSWIKNPWVWVIEFKRAA